MQFIWIVSQTALLVHFGVFAIQRYSGRSEKKKYWSEYGLLEKGLVVN